MLVVKVSPKFQVVIPQAVREAMDLHPGEKFQVIPYENRIELIPIRSMKLGRGFLKGLDTTIQREKDRRAISCSK